MVAHLKAELESKLTDYPRVLANLKSCEHDFDEMKKERDVLAAENGTLGGRYAKLQSHWLELESESIWGHIRRSWARLNRGGV